MVQIVRLQKGDRIEYTRHGMTWSGVITGVQEQKVLVLLDSGSSASIYPTSIFKVNDVVLGFRTRASV